LAQGSRLKPVVLDASSVGLRLKASTVALLHKPTCVALWTVDQQEFGLACGCETVSSWETNLW